MIDLSHSTATEWSTLLVGLASLISAIGSAIAALLAARNARGIEAVHAATNGMKAELVKSTGDRRYEEGRVHGEAYPRKMISKPRTKPKAKKRNRSKTRS